MVRKEIEEQTNGQDVAMFMDNQAVDHRILKMETDIGELRHQNAKFEQWFTEAGAANQHTAHRLQAVADQVSRKSLPLEAPSMASTVSSRRT